MRPTQAARGTLGVRHKALQTSSLQGRVRVYCVQANDCSTNLRTRHRQRVFGCVAHGLVHFAAVPKAHFNLGWMHVHVDAGRVHLDIQRVDRLAVAVQHVFIRAAGGVGEHLVAHIATVHIGKLLVGAGAGGVRDAGPSPDPHGRPTV